MFKRDLRLRCFTGAIRPRMNHFSRIPSLLVVFLLLFAIFSIGSLAIFPHSNASTSSTGVSLTNLETFNDYGQFEVNDTLSVNSNATSSLSSVTFGYPASYNGHLVELSANMNNNVAIPSSDISSSIQNQTLDINVKLLTSLSAQSPGNVTLGFYVIGTYVSQNTSASSCTTCYYLVPMLLYPSLSIPSFSSFVSHVASNITFPDPGVTEPSTNATSVGSAIANAGFSQQTSTFFRLFNSTTLNTNTSSFTNSVHWANVSVGSTATEGGIVDFQSIQRSFSVGSSGNLIVTDSLLVKNLGPNTLSSLNFGVLTGSSPNSSATVTIEPSGQTLLSNVQTATATGGVLDILSASGDTVEPNAVVQIVLQYPLGQQYGNFSGGIYRASVPETLPVNAIVDQFKTNFNIPSGFVVIQVPSSIALTNTSGSATRITLSYRLGVGAAYSFLLPIAGVVFVGVFVAALVFKPRGGKKEEEIETTLTSLVKAAEDKVSGTNDILSELKARGASVTKLDLSTARVRIEDLRSKSSGRFGTIRTELSAASTSAQTALSEAAADDREFDRAVRDLLNTYDQFISKRMKQESFTKAQQNNERRIQRITNALLDGLQDLRRDYEQEK